MAAALLAASLAYGIHCFYDWDWNIAALSLPAFLFLGVLAGRWAGPRSSPSAGDPRRPGRPRGRPGLRSLALASVATLWLSAFAVSVGTAGAGGEQGERGIGGGFERLAEAIRTARSEAALARPA